MNHKLCFYFSDPSFPKLYYSGLRAKVLYADEDGNGNWFLGSVVEVLSIGPGRGEYDFLVEQQICFFLHVWIFSRMAEMCQRRF